MKHTLVLSVALGLLAPLAQGCASRAAPFDDMDKAQITVLRLQGVEPPAPPPVAQQPAAGLPAIPIPGLTPDQQAQLQAAGQQLMQGVQQVIPGLPNLLPGQQQPAQTQPVQQQLPRFEGFVILAQQPLADESVKSDLLDLFGDADSFQAGHAPCFTPGMGIALARPNAPPVELLVSFNCNQAMIDGAQWPHKVNGLTPDSSQKLAKIYEKLWGAPVPPSGS